jgi:DNA polymerase-3 subunit gamma/tau
MVTTQGFNALLKIVEEPPAHVKFIFATTEPDKVIGTIRSRTHHYPFRLVPPGELLEYLTSVLESEGFGAEGGVMPLVVRASGGSVRDALSLLDQLIAGSEGKEIAYERAVNLLGFTHDQLMSEVIDAFAEIDPAKAFAAVDKVIQSGQDARRFLEDLLERIRDLMLVSSLGDGARAILRGLGPEQFDLLTIQANRFGLNQLTSAAEATSKALAETSAASNPRLQLELLCARVLAPAIEAPIKRVTEPVAAQPQAAAQPAKTVPVASPAAKIEPTPIVEKVAAAAAGPLTTASFKNGWQDILDALAKKSRSAWAVAFTTKVLDFEGDVLTLLFQSQRDVDAFKTSQGASEVLRTVIKDKLGVTVKYRAKVAEQAPPPVTAPVIEPTPAEEFVTEEEIEAQEPATEVIVQPVAPEDDQAGEFFLREVLGATPIKNEDK